MTIETDTYQAPEVWASYLINGDASGIDSEDVAECDAWRKSIAPWRVADVARAEDGEPQQAWFAWNCQRFSRRYSGCNLLDYVVHKPARAAPELDVDLDDQGTIMPPQAT